MLVELEGRSGTTIVVDQLGYFQQGRATLSDLSIGSTRGSTIPLQVSTPGLEWIDPVRLEVTLDSECMPGYFESRTAQGNKVCVACEKYTYELSGQCYQCKTGMLCGKAGLSLGVVRLKAGYWRTDDASVDIRQCRFDEVSCPGMVNGSYCGAEYEGPLCSKCADDHFMSWAGDGACHKCAAGQTHLPTVGLACVVTGCLVLIAISIARRRTKKEMDGPQVDSPILIAAEKMIKLVKVKLLALFFTMQV